jgi:Methyltransferase domain
MRLINVRISVRRALLRAGRRLSAKAQADLRVALGYLEIGAWLEGLPGQPRPREVGADTDLFAEALGRVTGARPLYLEFGVFEGRSMRWWAANLSNPDARLVGFDSFEGLPADWRPGLGKGHFSTGDVPDIDDERVTFVKGWFEETLPAFRVPDHDQLILNIDCDLYSSADTVLRWAEPHIVPGTLIYFDELPDRDHEWRAFQESLSRTGYEVRPIGYAQGGVHWLFEYVRTA